MAKRKKYLNRKLQKKKIVKINNTAYKTKYFIMAMGCSYVVMLVFVIITRGQSLEVILHCDPADTFMDHFNSIRDVKDLKPYENGVIYPPLANAFYTIMRHLIPKELMAVGRFELRNSQMGLVNFVILLMIVIISLYSVIKFNFRNTQESKADGLISVALIFSYPFIYSYERGNIIILALLFTMLFIVFRNHEKK